MLFAKATYLKKLLPDWAWHEGKAKPWNSRFEPFDEPWTDSDGEG